MNIHLNMIKAFVQLVEKKQKCTPAQIRNALATVMLDHRPGKHCRFPGQSEADWLLEMNEQPIESSEYKYWSRVYLYMADQIEVLTYPEVRDGPHRQRRQHQVLPLPRV